MADEPENTVLLNSSEAESEADESGESGFEHNNGFFDIEASESDADAESDGEPGSESGSGSDQDDVHYFPQFRRLPIELRHRIWEFFCPDLTAKSRVFNFMIVATMRDGIDADESATLEQQTAPARAVLATNRESRAMALRIFPDTLTFRGGHGMIPFNKDRDVVFVDISCRNHGRIGAIPGFTDKISHLAMYPMLFEPDFQKLDTLRFFLAFPDLRTVYSYASDSDHKERLEKWCVSDLIYRYYTRTLEIAPGLGENLQSIYCWPNLDQHRDFATRAIPTGKLNIIKDELKEAATRLKGVEIPGADAAPLTDEEVAQLGRIETWPMICFEFDEGLEAFDRLLELNIPDDWELSSGSSSESESDTDSDQYESEGIDDAEIDENEDTSSGGEDDLEDDLEVLPLLPDDESMTLDESDPLQHQLGDGDAAAQFSSPEPGSASAGESDASRSEAPQASRRIAGHPIRQIVSSSSEGESGGDSEGEKVKKRGGNRRARVVLSDSEEEEDSGPGTAQVADPATSESEEDGVSQEEPDEDQGTRKPMSLAERLQLHRKENPVPPSGSDDDSDAEASGGDYDGRNYAEFEGFEEDGELGGDAEDQPANGMFMGMAEESDEESG